MTTTKNAQTTAQQLAETEAKADALRAEARELQAKADAEAQQAEADELAARIKFEQQRERDYPQNFVKPMRELRAAFEEAVTTGGDYIGAWIKYRATVNAAGRELGFMPRYRYEQALAQYQAVARQIEGWQNELQARANNVTRDQPALGPDREPTGAWTETIRGLIGDDQPSDDETRVQQINRRLNELADALNKNVHREPESIDWIQVLDYAGDKPSERYFNPGENIDKRTFQQAFEQALNKGIEEASAEFARHRSDDWQKFHKS
ncbi:hypothetical protein [Citricoccus nitrophenolicus]|uniref:hypothetical protein n=1 Tax=Citricoccus nitrophenolicus TaxID=863575 RepID=UPI0031E8AFFE